MAYIIFPLDSDVIKTRVYVVFFLWGACTGPGKHSLKMP